MVTGDDRIDIEIGGAQDPRRKKVPPGGALQVIAGLVQGIDLVHDSQHLSIHPFQNVPDITVVNLNQSAQDTGGNIHLYRLGTAHKKSNLAYSLVIGDALQPKVKAVDSAYDVDTPDCDSCVFPIHIELDVDLLGELVDEAVAVVDNIQVVSLVGSIQLSKLLGQAVDLGYRGLDIVLDAPLQVDYLPVDPPVGSGHGIGFVKYIIAGHIVFRVV